MKAALHTSIILLLLFSLSIGLTAYMLISAKVTYNRSFDTHLDNSKNIYRIISSTYTDNVLTIRQPLTQRILGQTLKEKYPEVKASGFICSPEENHYKIGVNSFTNDNSLYCSNGFTNIFTLEIAQGKSTALLTKPNMVVISESFANKHFGNANPIGEIIKQYPNQKFEVEAVYKDFSKSSHITPDFLISFHDNMFLPPPLKENWGWVRFYTYLELEDNSDVEKIEDGITQLCYEHNETQMKNSNSEFEFELQAIPDIHTQSNYKNEIGNTVRGDYLTILQLISIFILIVSGFNYIYFSYTRISSSSTQFGIKKVFGANNVSLLSQFLLESLIIHTISLTISVLTIIFLQRIPDLLNGFIPFNELPDKFWISLLLIFTFSTISNPIVLMFMLVKKSSIALLSQKFKTNNNNNPFSFQKLFTVTQFIIIIFLVSSIIGINKQVNYLKTRDKGMEIDNKLVIKTPGNRRRSSNIGKNLEAFEQEIAKIGGVSSVSTSDKVPGDVPTFTFSASEQKDKSGIKTACFIAGNNFLKSFHIDILGGEGFKQQNNNDCIINYTCMKQLGYNNPDEIIGRRLYLQDESMMQTIEAHVISVCKDFNFINAKELSEPLVLIDWTKEVMLGNYTLSINPKMDKQKLISQIEGLFYNTFPNYPFNYIWVEDYYNKQFEEENSIISSLKIFAFIAILLGVLSLLSMVLHISLARTKEIGIRKVNGAKQSDIIRLLNLNFVQWIGIASLLAVPLSWFFLRYWLNAFAYKTNINIWIFLISSGVAFIIGITTVTVQSLKVANMNPVESIKYE
jgi:putative ABC transport system permease protein